MRAALSSHHWQMKSSLGSLMMTVCYNFREPGFLKPWQTTADITDRLIIYGHWLLLCPQFDASYQQCTMLLHICSFHWKTYCFTHHNSKNNDLNTPPMRKGENRKTGENVRENEKIITVEIVANI